MSSVTNFNLVMNPFLFQNKAIFFSKCTTVYKAAFDIGLCVLCSRFLLAHEVCNLEGNMYAPI